MSGILQAILVFWLPVLVIGGGCLFWASRTKVPWLCRPLRLGALFWIPVLTVCLALVLATAITCNGNFLYGYEACTLFSNNVSNMITPVAFLGYAIAALYTAIVCAVGFVAELRAISNP